MTILSIRGVAVAALMAALAAPAFAAESRLLGSEGDWSAFGGDDPKECWAVSPPKSTKNTQDGKEVEVTRSDIRLYIAYRPGQNGEISFQGGYPFAPDSTVDVEIGSNKFKLFTDGENAWTGSPDEDAKLISALRAGSEAVAAITIEYSSAPASSSSLTRRTTVERFWPTAT